MTETNIIERQVIAEEYRDIWKTLSTIDVSKHVEKKNGLSYLSWAWAWGVLMEHFPHAEYSFSSPELHQDGTVTVHCDVMIGNCHRTMWLPVMDYKNNAIKTPDARKISDTKMRCLVKCLAMYGLGHYIYASSAQNLLANSRSLPTTSAAPSSVGMSLDPDLVGTGFFFFGSEGSDRVLSSSLDNCTTDSDSVEGLMSSPA